MISPLPLACRVVLWIAGRIVPAALREDWRREWEGELCYWKTRPRLLRHATGAFPDALHLRFTDEELRARPAFCLALCIFPIAVIALTSNGFTVTRRLLSGLPYRDSERLAVLSQTGPFMGQRLGVRRQHLDAFERSRAFEGVASYHPYRAALAFSAGAREIEAASISANFLHVLGATPAIGDSGGAGAFLVSFEFWSRELRADARIIGSTFSVAGRPMKLAGVLPPGFSFLSATPPVWTVAPDWPPLSTAVARLRAGVTPIQAEAQLRSLIPLIEVRSLPALAYRAARLYAIGALLFLTVVGLWGAAAPRYRAFFVLKCGTLLIALLLVLFEFTGAARLGPTGNALWFHEAVSAWLFLFGSGAILRWSRLDQRMRCRVCLHRMSLPVRIGAPGRILLDHAGLEVVCPRGHGSVYAAESVLGAEISGRWMAEALTAPK
ncbi:MAG: ABC transporter permease [Bryobacteraceae bacterium]